MRRERGAALLLVVLLIALLAVLVVEFQREARLEFRAAANLRDALQAHALARSGVAVASALLLADAEDNAVDDRTELWAGEVPPVPLGEGILGVTIEDLDGRFPLGALVDDKGKAVPSWVASYQRLLETLELEDADPAELTDALVDWIDADTDGPYESNPDYAVPNVRVEHLEGLGRVEGYGPAVLRKLLPHLDTRADKAINVNTAPAPVLASLHASIDPAAAEELYRDLGEEPVIKADALRNHPALRDVQAFSAIAQNLKVESGRFRLRLFADVRGVNRRAEAVLVRDRKEKKVRVADWLEE